MRAGIQKTLFVAILTLCCALFCPVLALAQATSGLRGLVTDPTGAVLPNASVLVKHVETNVERKLTTNSEGIYIADNLQPGDYDVRIEATGFQRQQQRVTVLVGNTQTADFSLAVGSSNETVMVTSETPQLNTSDYKIDQVITRERIEELPLNGRNFLELAQMEPSVVVVQDLAPAGRANNFTQVRVAGVDPALTRITADGVSIGDRVTGGAATNFSQESVQEFQISTFNFDLSTGVTGVGAVNVVTRGGGNKLRGSGFYFFRDHNMSAYPSLRRPTDPAALSPFCAVPDSAACKRAQDPYFVRRQTGFTLSGPVKKDKFFWFTNFEYMNLTNVVEVTHDRTVGDNGAFASQFNHTGSGWFRGKQFNTRLDYKLNDKHNGFLRYTEEHNRSLQTGGDLESTWDTAYNNAYNAVLGVTSILSNRVVNDLRLSWNLLTHKIGPDPTSCDHPVGCLGVFGPSISVGGTGFAIGGVTANDRRNRTYQITDNLSWQKGTHRVRFGGEWEKYSRFGLTITNDTGAIALFGPEQVRVSSRADLYPLLPASLRGVSDAITLADILKLPVATFSINVGDPSSPAPYNRERARRTDRYRLYFQDGWQAWPRFTLNYGVSWVYETGLRNYDLDKPEYLLPLLGSRENLKAPPHEYRNFAPALGLAWALGKSKKTVIRGGSGIYYDSDLGFTRINERRLLGPVGNGRVAIAGSAIPNALFGQTGQPQFMIGASSGAVPTNLTGEQLVAQIARVRAEQLARLGPVGTLPGPRNIELFKSGTGIFDVHTRTPYTIQATGGVQREIIRNMVLNVDFVMRRGVAFGGPHSVFDVDLNRFNGVRVLSVDPVTNVSVTEPTRVLPLCATQAERDSLTARCSTGSITFYQSASNSRYVGLHIRLDKRFADRYQMTVSYALARYNTWNGILNLNNWHQSYGPNAADRKHKLNISGIWELPQTKRGPGFLRGVLNGWQLSGIGQFRSPLPIAAGIFTVDHDGDGISTYYLPGTNVNTFGRSTSIEDLRKAVDAYNTSVIAQIKPLPAAPTAAQTAACTFRHALLNNTNTVTTRPMCAARTPRNQVYPLITLPDNFSTQDTVITTDLRLTRRFRVRERVTLSVIGEGFNLFNIANLGGYTGNLQSTNFGQATNRTNNVFGSGGPRAFQLAARLSF